MFTEVVSWLKSQLFSFSFKHKTGMCTHTQSFNSLDVALNLDQAKQFMDSKIYVL